MLKYSTYFRILCIASLYIVTVDKSCERGTMKTINHKRFMHFCAISALVTGCVAYIFGTATACLYIGRWSTINILDIIISFTIGTYQFYLSAKAFKWYGIMYIAEKYEEMEENESVSEQN